MSSAPVSCRAALCSVCCACSCVGQCHPGGTVSHQVVARLLPTSAVWAKDCRCIMHGHLSRRGGNSREKERGGKEVGMGRRPPSAPWIWYLSVLSGGPLLPRTPCPTWCFSIAPAPPAPPSPTTSPPHSPSRSLTPSVNPPAVCDPPQSPQCYQHPGDTQETLSSASSRGIPAQHPHGMGSSPIPLRPAAILCWGETPRLHFFVQL